MIKIFWSIFLGLHLIGCAAINRPSSLETIDSQKKREQELKIQSAEQLLFQMKSKSAELAFKSFEKEFPVSIFSQRVRFGIAQSYEQQGRCLEALEIYKTVVKETSIRQPEISARASFEMSFCYEVIGDESLLQATLLDARRREMLLPPEISTAEIPARLASSYYRTGKIRESQEELKKADIGLKNIRKEFMDDNRREWLAHIYYKMGYFSTLKVDENNISELLDTLRIIQIFSLRSVEENSGPWSKLAEADLINNYRTLWMGIKSLRPKASLDKGAAKLELKNVQIKLIEKWLNYFQELKSSIIPLEKGEVRPELNLFKELEMTRKEVSLFLSNLSIMNELTPEAEKLKEIKK